IQVATGREISRMSHDNAVQKLAVSIDGKLATGGSDHTLHLLADAAGKQILHDSSSGKVLAVTLSADAKDIAIARSSGTAKVELVVTSVAQRKQLLSSSGELTTYDV